MRASEKSDFLRGHQISPAQIAARAELNKSQAPDYRLPPSPRAGLGPFTLKIESRPIPKLRLDLGSVNDACDSFQTLPVFLV